MPPVEGKMIEEMQKLYSDIQTTKRIYDAAHLQIVLRQLLLNNAKELLELAKIGLVHKARMEKLEKQLNENQELGR